ncbi:MBL fold metallo-hydrolase [Streptomyces solicathayae]|uniref:MBL fold metallo-hydrolase n=1 Tax=Streptomyces solicathayae TaxID=3081768 RepID=A0ABZ0M3Q2_9ACTN|nr:MBL fold metallo-hydrolase [Streptomyces sp. HUAS YS2]WOX26329.1 MBL fold metallo-hydrolase [Streptomyces sp. HUAS YS2]
MESIVLGDVEIIRVREWQGPFAPALAVFPDIEPEAWRAEQRWLAPDHWEPAADQYVGALQTWVVRSEGRTVLVDTGVGDDRERPDAPQFHRRQSDFPARLAAAGIHPEDVDVVINTHLHADHVGWNTEARDGEWAPMFPRATYYLPAADRAYAEQRQPHLFADSVAPVLRAGQAVLWEDTLRLDAHLTLEAAPGHTPGSCVLRVASGGERAVFVGDILHSPVQLRAPACNSCFCEDPAQAAATRRGVLERATDTKELVIPAHFAGAGAAEVHRDGERFTVTRWAAF